MTFEQPKWIKKTVLITARTYPVPAKKGLEVSCTAGITDDGEWIRLFPIPYRWLDQDRQFRKYQYIEAMVTKSTSDRRPESHKIDITSIKIVPRAAVPTENKWEARMQILLPLKSRSLCFLQAERDSKKEPTLGFFRPRAIHSFKIERTRADWTDAELSKLTQYSLFDNAPTTQLRKLPFEFSYEFTCDEPSCRGHCLSCTDWEMGAAFWKWEARYGAKWEQMFRKTFETEMILKNDTHFYVGTLHGHPSEWVIIGLFYPPA